MTTKIALLALEGDFTRSLGEGTLVYMYELYKWLKRMEKKEDIHVDKVEHRVHDAIGRRFSFALNNVFANLSSYDIAHSLTLMPMYNIGSKKTIKFMTAHDFQFLLAPELGSDKRGTLTGRLMWSRTLLNFATKMTLDSADYLMVNSIQTGKEAELFGFDRKRIFVVNHGMDDRYLAAVPKKRRHEHFKVGYIGAFRVRKNAGFAVRAFKFVRDRDMRLELWGNQKFEYDNIVRTAGSDKRVSFPGFAPEDKVVDIYDSFDAFVYPSHYEGEGLSILEAQARGLPVVICKNARISPEVRKYCFEAEDEIHMARVLQDLKDNGYKEGQRKKAMAYARTFTWENTAKGTLKAYQKALKER